MDMAKPCLETGRSYGPRSRRKERKLVHFGYLEAGDKADCFSGGLVQSNLSLRQGPSETYTQNLRCVSAPDGRCRERRKAGWMDDCDLDRRKKF